MKSYKDFEKIFIGSSDIAALTLVGMSTNGELIAEILEFGHDDRYSAYLVTEEALIGSHYEKRFAFESWLRIYDDDDCVIKFRGDRIDVYRAGEMGCIIRVREKNYKR